MVYKQIEEDLSENIFIEDETLLDYIYQRINELNLDDYIKCSIINNDSDSEYNFHNLSLVYNPNECLFENADRRIPDLTHLLSKREKNTGIIKDPNISNIYNLCSINHEIAHAYQNKVMHEEDHSLMKAIYLRDYYSQSIDYDKFNAYFYNKFHDNFFIEYSANIESYLETISLLNALHIPSLEKDLKKLNMMVARHILFLYKDIEKNRISCPVKNSMKLYDVITTDSPKYNLSEYKNEKKPQSQFERLLYGFPINYRTYNYLNSISKNHIKTLNLFDEIHN